MPVNRPEQARVRSGDGLLLSLIIISFNSRDLTLGAIASVIGQMGGDGEIIVVDNASTDDSAARIAKHFPQVKLLVLRQNIGFGRANNLAAERARGRYLLLLNPDTLVQPGAIAALLDFARRRPEARIWGGRTLAADGRLNPRSCARQMLIWFTRLSSRIFQSAGFRRRHHQISGFFSETIFNRHGFPLCRRRLAAQ